jgi:sulfur-carrier protein
LITIHISGHLKDYTGKKRTFEIPEEVQDVASLVGKLNQMFPGIKDRIFDDQDVTREFVNIFVNGTNIRETEKEYTRLEDGDTVHILPSVAGGWDA